MKNHPRAIAIKYALAVIQPNAFYPKAFVV